MNYEQLKKMVKAGCLGVNTAEFSAEEANVAALNALLEQFGLNSNSSLYEIRRHKEAVMSVIDETINEMLPARMTDILGRFAEVKNFNRDDEVMFSLKGLGKARARTSIVKGARSGIYKAVRLDSREFQMPTMTYTVGVYVTLEEILLGKYTLAELFANILEGFEEIVYKEVVAALRSAATIAPSKNLSTVASYGTSDYDDALEKSIRIAKAYGEPLIVGFRSALSHLNNAYVSQYPAAVNPNIPAADLDDMRNYGVVRIYKGVNMLELPNYFEDEQNNKWVFEEDMVFVLPGDAKPVKVAFRGDMVTVENKNDTGSEKMNSSKMMGVGLALANNVCVITVPKQTW